MALLTWGCGSATRDALHQPLMVKCENAGLSHCAVIADGLVRHLDGEVKAAKKLLKKPSSVNSPDAIASFIWSFDGLIDREATKKYVVDLRRSAQSLMLDDGYRVGTVGVRVAPGGPEPKPAEPAEAEPEAEAPASAAPMTAAAGSRAVRAVTADTDSSRLRTRTKIVSGRRGKPCGALTDDDARCLTLVKGPFVLTDLVSEGSCNMFVSVAEVEGDHGSSRWQQRAPIAQHALRVQIAKDRALYVGYQRTDVACAITWSGFRPYEEAP